MKDATHYYDHHIRIYYKVEPGVLGNKVWFWDKYTQRWLKSYCYPPVEFMTKK